VDTLTVAALIGAFVTAGLVKGVIGVGLPLTAIAVLGNFMSLKLAVPLMVVPVMITNVWQAAQGGQLGTLFRRFLTMNLGSCAGLWFGTHLLYSIDARPFAAVLGILVCAYGVMNLFALKLRIDTRYEPVISPLLGLGAGVLGGLTGSIGMLMIVYMQALGLTKEEFVQAINFTFFTNSLVWVAALASAGAFDLETGALSAAAVAPALVGMGAGRAIRSRMSQKRFGTFVFVFLIVTGISLIRKGLFAA